MPDHDPMNKVAPKPTRPRARQRGPALAPPPRITARRVRFIAVLAVLGPGLVSGFADNDAGGITTYSLAGIQFGYDLLWVILASQIVLFFTQEVGARIGLATGQGMTGLIRERFGVRWATFAAMTMLVANLGTTIAEFAGIGAALQLFGVPVPVSAALAAVAMVVLISWGSFSKIQYLFVAVGVGVSLAYMASAVLARPDWGRAAVSLVIPHGTLTNAYWLAVVGTVGTTITPWGQAFIQAYVVDKRLGSEDMGAERLDVGLGSFLTNLIAGFIVVACAATLWTAGKTDIPDAATAALALGPLAGPAATVLFAVGLLAASLLGLGVVPLSSAYTACEAFGWETGVGWRWREAPAFYCAPRVLRRLRGVVCPHPGAAAHPGDVPLAGPQWPAPAVHPRVRDAPVVGPPDHGRPRERPWPPRDRLDLDHRSRPHVDRARVQLLRALELRSTSG